MLERQHPNSLEKVGVGLATSIETFRGCNIQLVHKTAGFNGLSTNKGGEVRKIEVKTMSHSFNWIAISSIVAIDKLFFERDYWIYYVLLPKNYVVMTKGLPFIQQQLSLSINDSDFLTELETWMKLTKHLKRKTGLKFLPKLQIKFPQPLDKLTDHLIKNPDDKIWHNSVIEIWQNQKNWECLYKVPVEI
jgi:hypothetical protein